MSSDSLSPAVSSHYTRGDLEQDILAGLRSAGHDVDHLRVDDLLLVDQFHTRGKQATLDLAELAKIGPGQRILDMGGGIGGSARLLSSEFACRVRVLDLTEQYCRVGESLTRRTGLSDRVTFSHGSALDPPFDDASFDVVWTQHSTMNISDKQRLYEQIVRVLRPGGTLAMHEILAGPVQPIHFPVPWASHPQISHLVEPQALRPLLRSVGLREIAWNEETPRVREWLAERLSATSAPPPVGLHLILGPDARRMFENVLRNVDEQRVVVVQAVLQKPK